MFTSQFESISNWSVRDAYSLFTVLCSYKNMCSDKDQYHHFLLLTLIYKPHLAASHISLAVTSTYGMSIANEMSTWFDNLQKPNTRDLFPISSSSSL